MMIFKKILPIISILFCWQLIACPEEKHLLINTPHQSTYDIKNKIYSFYFHDGLFKVQTNTYLLTFQKTSFGFIDKVFLNTMGIIQIDFDKKTRKALKIKTSNPDILSKVQNLLKDILQKFPCETTKDRKLQDLFQLHLNIT
jgi:hypothetical protein